MSPIRDHCAYAAQILDDVEFGNASTRLASNSCIVSSRKPDSVKNENHDTNLFILMRKRRGVFPMYSDLNCCALHVSRKGRRRPQRDRYTLDAERKVSEKACPKKVGDMEFLTELLTRRYLLFPCLGTLSAPSLLTPGSRIGASKMSSCSCAVHQQNAWYLVFHAADAKATSRATAAFEATTSCVPT